MELSLNQKNYYELNLTESFLYFYVLSDYLTLNDIRNVSYISKYTYKNKINIDYRLRLFKKRSAIIIINFLKKANNTFKNLNYDLNGLTSRDFPDDFPIIPPHKYLKKLFCIYMVKAYSYYKEWYIGIGGYDYICKKNNMINQYNRQKINNPSRFDYFKLIYQMSINDIYYIGW